MSTTTRDLICAQGISFIHDRAFVLQVDYEFYQVLGTRQRVTVDVPKPILYRAFVTICCDKPTS